MIAVDGDKNIAIPNIWHCLADPAAPVPANQVCPSSRPSVNPTTYKTTSGTDRMYNITRINPLIPTKFNVTVENSGDGPATATQIDVGSKLITLIPAGFQGLDNTNTFRCTGGLAVGPSPSITCNNPTIKTFDDGSKQLSVSVRTGAPITDLEKATFSFVVFPPVTEETHMYLFFHLLSGGVNNNADSLGSLSEIVVQVCGTRTGCPPL
jgi:hypothetical protein